jgi:hypothetical protein
MQDNLEAVVDLCCLFLQPQHDMFKIRYPAATVLLDLTASENCIERIGMLIMERDLMKVVIKELRSILLRKVPRYGGQSKLY